MRKGLVVLSCVVLLSGFLAEVCGGPAPEDFAIWLEPVGDSTTVRVLGSWKVDDVQGYSWGICHDPAEVAIECPGEHVAICGRGRGDAVPCRNVVCTDELAVLRLGEPPHFLSVNIYENGITQGAVFDIL